MLYHSYGRIKYNSRGASFSRKPLFFLKWSISSTFLYPHTTSSKKKQKCFRALWRRLPRFFSHLRASASSNEDVFAVAVFESDALRTTRGRRGRFVARSPRKATRMRKRRNRRRFLPPERRSAKKRTRRRPRLRRLHLRKTKKQRLRRNPRRVGSKV